MPERDPIADVPESSTVAKKRTRLSLVWIVPIVAAVIGAWVAVTTIFGRGPTITIVLPSAEGVEAGKTKVRYNGLDVGAVTSVRLADDLKRVVASVAMAPKTQDLLVEDTKFWVVTPRISGANVTGLGTLLSGSYIGMEVGTSVDGRRDFEALAVPPVVTAGLPGRFFVLKSADMGSVDYGTPVYFRRLQVGQIASFELDKDGRGVTIKIFIHAPYDQYVTPETRFWHASGIDMTLSAGGVNVKTESLLSVIVGGLAFETPAFGPALPPAEAETVFTLYADRAEALRPPPKNPHSYLLVFNESVRGLAPGAPVEFRGIPVGQVEDVRAELDRKNFTFSVLVIVGIDAERLGVKISGLSKSREANEAGYRQFVETMVARGLRAQLRTGNLVTGALYVAFDFFPDAPPTTVNWSKQPVQLATAPGKFEGLEANIASIVKKLDQVQYQEISEDLRKTLANVDRTLAAARQALDHAGTVVRSDSEVSQELTGALRDVRQAAQGLRSLTDYLERHPESLIRGKPEEAK